MRDLRLDLDTLEFDEMAEIARSQIPSLAPHWTDHNVHDPGIMLTELVAWIADAQIYSLGRDRRDERRAYARLMGIDPAGPRAARGFLWPDRELAFEPARRVPWPRGRIVEESDTCSVTHSDAPPFHPAAPVYLTTCKLTRVLARAEDGAESDHTRVNEHGASVFTPLGLDPGRNACLRLEFAAGATASSAPSADQATLAIGFEVPGVTRDMPVARASRLRVRLTDAKGIHDLNVIEDGTAMFTHTGVLRLAIEPRDMGVDDAFVLQIDCPAGEWLVTPRVTRISPNVIPLLQSERLTWIDVGAGQGVPDQELTLPRPGLQFGGTQPIRVRAFESGAWREWQVVEDFEASGPDDHHVCVFVDSHSIRFGNGVNGRLLENGAPVQASYSVSQGSKGNLPANMVWTMSGIAGVFGSNPAIMSGGADADIDRDLQIAARARLNGARPIVTTGDLQEAALSFADLRVRRAEEMIAPAGSEQRVAGARHLLVVGEREPEAWRREIHARLAPRLPVGQRLEVIAPRYVIVTLRARLAALPRVDTGAIRDSAVENLERRLALSAKPDSPAWPLGRKVTRAMVSAWLRKIAGVARVLDVNLFADGQSVGEEIVIPAAGLPLLRLAPGDIRVLRDGERETP